MNIRGTCLRPGRNGLCSRPTTCTCINPIFKRVTRKVNMFENDLFSDNYIKYLKFYAFSENVRYNCRWCLVTPLRIAYGCPFGSSILNITIKDKINCQFKIYIFAHVRKNVHLYIFDS